MLIFAGGSGSFPSLVLTVTSITGCFGVPLHSTVTCAKSPCCKHQGRFAALNHTILCVKQVHRVQKEDGMQCTFIDKTLGAPPALAAPCYSIIVCSSAPFLRELACAVRSGSLMQLQSRRCLTLAVRWGLWGRIGPVSGRQLRSRCI